MDPNLPVNPEQDLMISPDDTLMNLEETTPTAPVTPAAQEEVSYTPPRAWGQDESAAPMISPATPSPIFSETLPPIVSPDLPPKPENPPFPTAPTTPINPPVAPESSSLLRTILIGIALILLGTFLGVLASRFVPMPSGTILPLPNTSLTPVVTQVIVSPTVEITPIPTPTATPSALLNLKWNMMTVKSPVSTFKSYQVYYPTTWTIKAYKNTPSTGYGAGLSSLTLQKGKNTFSILQYVDREVRQCLYPDDTKIEGLTTSFGEYHSLNKDRLSWRWSKSLPSADEEPIYQVCESKSDSFYTSPTSIGFIEMPATSTESAVLDEFNYILEKIVIVVPPTAMPYQCPVNGYVDCMPILDEIKKKACSDEAMDWYKANCPNFQGAAL